MTTTEEETTEAEAVVADDTICCASCGRPAVDDVKLKKCDGGCDLVKYCTIDCQDNHRSQHEEECVKRLAEIRDRDLFTMPDESHLGDCSICCLPLPLNERKFGLMTCCSKSICLGCSYANKKREFEAGLKQRCAYCREPLPKAQEESDKSVMKRIKKNCPVAMTHMGTKCDGKGDHKSALKYYIKAAELGDADAHYNLSIMYREGEGVEKDMEKSVYHAEQAAIGGHPEARHYLGLKEASHGQFERARKHFIIAANLGYDDSLKGLRELYAIGHASKEDYAGALRAYQTAVKATKSAQREEAEAYYEAMDAAQQS
jgi:hypothetical protein